MMRDAECLDETTGEHPLQPAMIRLLLVTALLFGFSKSDAQTTSWGGVDSSWMNPANWSGGVPTDTSSTTIISTAPYPVVPAPTLTDTATTGDLIIQSGGKVYFQNSPPGLLLVYGSVKLQNNASVILGSGTMVLKDSASFLSGGIFQSDSGTITLEGSTWIFKSGATFDPGSGTVVFQGAGNQTLTGNITFNNLIINTPDTVSLSGKVTVTGNLTVGVGATLVVPLGDSLTVDGTVTNNGTIAGGGSYPLPVEMVSLAATTYRLTTRLQWTTATETNNYGFDIERKSATAGWNSVGFVSGGGTTSSTRRYAYVDNVDAPGMYEYRVKQIDKTGSFKYSGTLRLDVGGVAKVLSLESNYPNPFNPSTSIEFSVPTDGRVVLKIYNIVGQEVATLFDGAATAGTLQKATFDASKLPSGVYFSRLEFGGRALVKRMMLVK